MVSQVDVVRSKDLLSWVNGRFRLRQVEVIGDYDVSQNEVFAKPATFVSLCMERSHGLDHTSGRALSVLLAYSFGMFFFTIRK